MIKLNERFDSDAFKDYKRYHGRNKLVEEAERKARKTGHIFRLEIIEKNGRRYEIKHRVI